MTELALTPDERKADDAFAVHAALLRAERDKPSLADNPQWQLVRMDAAERFRLLFEAVI